MSLDGFIAGVEGDMSWLIEHLVTSSPDIDLMADIGALLVGKRTFTGDDPNSVVGDVDADDPVGRA